MTNTLRSIAGVLLAGLSGAGLASPVHAGNHAVLAKPATPETRGLYLQLIRQARADGRVRAALAYLDDFDRQYRDDPEARALRINCLLDLGDLVAAQALVAKIPKDAGGAETEMVRGHVLAAAGRWGDAIGPYQAAVRLSPADALARNALGYAQLRVGQVAPAVENFRASVDLAPGAPVLRNNLLLALLMSGDERQVETRMAGLAPAERAILRGQLEKEAARIAGLAGIARRPGSQQGTQQNPLATPVPPAKGKGGVRS